MAIPKLKVYRLDSNYSPTNDTDVQSITQDELYPVVEKDLNVFNADELVGVVFRDAQTVISDAVSNYTDVAFKVETAGTSKTLTNSIPCNDWRINKNLINVYVKKVLLSGSSSSTSSSSSGSSFNIRLPYQRKAPLHPILAPTVKPFVLNFGYVPDLTHITYKSYEKNRGRKLKLGKIAYSRPL